MKMYGARVKAILGTAALALMLSGCGSGSSSTTATSKTYVESTACRQTIARIASIAKQNTGNGLDKNTFTGRYDQLTKIAAQARPSCSAQVQAPLLDAMGKYGDVNAEWTACGFGLCQEAKITREILSAQASFDKAAQLAVRQR